MFYICKINVIYELHCLDGKDAISTLKGVEQIKYGD